MNTKSKILNMQFDYEARLIAAAKDPDGWEHDVWIIHIGNESIDYKTGTGHRKTKRTSRGIESKPVPPKIDDVLYCLVADSYASECAFSDWCSDFGYDTDSRTALATYEACQENGLKLRRLRVDIDKAREAFQDY